MKKFLWIFGVGAAALLVVVSLGVGFYLGPIVKIGLEQLGPRIAQVAIKVDAIDISLITGSAAIKGLVIGNPEGYASSQAMSVGHVAVRVSPMSCVTHKIVVYSVHVESPEITFEGGLSRNNLSKILDNINSFSKNLNPSTPSSPSNTAASSSSNPALKIEVDDFLVTGAKVHVNLSGLVSRDISLPDIHLMDLGKDSGGLSPSDLAGTILKVISKDTLTAVAGSVKSITSDVKSLIGKTAVSTVTKSLDKITKGLGGLFN